MNKLILTYLFCCLFTSLLSVAQSPSAAHSNQSDVAAWYKIADEKVEQILKVKQALTDSTLLNNWLYTTPTKHSPQNKNLKGYYLKVTANGENLDIELNSFNSISAQVLHFQEGFALRVVDSMGVFLPNANVFFQDKALPFDSKTQTYRCDKCDKSGFLKLEALGESVFYDVEEKHSYNYSYKKTFFQTKVGKIVRFPYTFVRKSWWRIKNFTFFEKKHRERDYQGYIACNQPKYQPFDTLKVKAFIANRKGKPLNKTLEARLHEQYRRKIIWKQKVEPKPNREGNYEVELVLGDSLQLDQSYVISFHKIKDEYNELMSQSFHYEDYELDAIDFTFESNQQKYNAGDSIQLHLSAQYKTGLYVPDAYVKLTARTKVLTESNKLNNFQSKETFVKDTIWRHEQALNPSDTSLINFPLAVLPKSNAEIWIDAEFTDSSGEYQDKSISFEVLQKNLDGGCLSLRLEGEYIIAECIKNGVSVPQKVSFDIMGINSDIYGEREIELPYKERINGGIWDYSIYSLSLDSDDFAELDLKEQERTPYIHIRSYERNDSIYISLQNQRRISLYYTIYAGKKPLVRGKTDEKEFVWGQKKSSQENYFMDYSYLWGDEPHFEREAFNFSKNRLDINIEQAQNIRPGETVNVKITAKDQQKKAASKVNVLAGAINSQFDTYNNFSGPYLQQKKAKEPKSFPTLELDMLDSKKASKDLSKKLLDKLQLKQKLYYQLRYSSNGVFMHSDSIEGITPQDTFYRDIAQFSPYLVKDGKEQPIYLIYCNQRLVYYYEVNSQIPYSFVGEEGYNQIQIRGKDFSYTIDSVLLKKGRKLTFSIDENNYRQSKESQHIRRESTEAKLSQKECNLLAQQIFFLQIPFSEKGEYYILQDAETIHPIKPETHGLLKIGPFYPRDNLTLIRRGHYHNTFLFEEGYQYEIAANRERLYENTHFSKPFDLPSKLSPKPIGERLFHPKNIVYEQEDTDSGINFDESPYQTNSSNGIYEFEYETPAKLKNDFMAVALTVKDSTYGVYEQDTRKIHNLPPQDYQLLLIQKNGYYFQKNFTIEANTLTFQRIDSTANFVSDSNYLFFNNVMQKRLSKKVFVPLKYNISNTNKQITGNGRSGIKGIVTDAETGETLPFVNVAVSIGGVLVGTTTDFDGYYEMNLRKGTHSLIFSYVGYQSQRIDGIIVGSAGHREVNMEMATNSEMLDEIIVVAYSIEAPLMKRNRDILEMDERRTVSAEELISIPVKSLHSIAGEAAGAVVNKRNNYYIDALKVQNSNPLQTETKKQQLRSNFKDYAYWQPNLLTDQNGEAYFTVTFPDNATQWNTFALGMNDKGQGGLDLTKTNAYKDIMAELSIPRFLIEGDETNILGKSLNYTGDSLSLQTQFKIEDDVIQSNTAIIKEVLVEKAKITAPSSAKNEHINLTYSLQLEDGYGDGEKRQIPILKKGTGETIGEFYALENDTTIQLSFNEDLGEVNLYAQNSILDLLQSDLVYLQNYPYGCNEQNASRLMAFLMDKEIKTQLNQPFRHEQAIRKTIKKLEKAKNNNGTWGWWQGNSFNLWMTLYVSKALKEAKHAGYSVESDEWTVRHLVNLLPKLKGRDLLTVLSHLSEINLNTDYQKYLQKADSTITQPQLYDQLKILQIRQVMELPYDLQLLDSLRQVTTFGNYYWGKRGYAWQDNAIQNTLLAFDLYQRTNRTEDSQKIIGYFLERRGRKHWRNTFETAQILQAILPTLLNESGGELKENQLAFSGAFNETITEFPFEAKFSVNKDLTVHKTGSTPLYFTTYQSFWNPKPQAKSNVFVVQTHWKNKANQTIQTLKTAEKATLAVDIEVKESAEYVMIEVPISAGCSYGNKGKNSSSHEVHREYFKEKVVIFCQELPAGKHYFEVPLEARYGGNYTVNPTKIEQMYFPVFYGRNEVKKVEVSTRTILNTE